MLVLAPWLFVAEIIIQEARGHEKPERDDYAQAESGPAVKNGEGQGRSAGDKAIGRGAYRVAMPRGYHFRTSGPVSGTPG